VEEQLRRSAAAWRVVAAVVLVVWTAGAIALAYPFMANEQPLWAVGVALGGLLGALLWVGLITLMSRVVDGLAELTDLARFGREAPPQSSTPPALPTANTGGLRVKQPGAYLREELGGDALDWLTPGTGVVEEERRGDSVRVTTAAGSSGWVDAQQLDEGPGSAEGSP
jgi:hypothetical protein